MSENKSKTRVIVPCRLSYARIWSPNEDGKYSVCLLIPKSDTKTLKKIQAAVEAAKSEGKHKLANKAGNIPVNIKTPLRDGDEEKADDENYVDHMFFNANSKNKPGIVDRRKQEIIDEEEVYSGCYANVSVSFYAFSVDGNKGIAAGLGNIQKLKDGERLSGGPSADEEFDDLGDDDDDDFLS